MNKFDGREFAAEIEKKVASESAELQKKGIYPAFASILVGEDPASKLYLSLKKKAAERVGIEMSLIEFDADTPSQKVIGAIEELNNNPEVQGIMVQMPLPVEILNFKFQILNSINPHKDVDGLREDSPYMPATVKAIMKIIETEKIGKNEQIMIVGNKGTVGRRLYEVCSMKYIVSGLDIETKITGQLQNADVVISCTGRQGLITVEMVKEGVKIIDIGAPVGDAAESALAKASFYTPVPGGVGPVTIACLLENVVEAASQFKNR